jgi:ribosome-associated translation inhibitor RaiA
MQVPLEVEIVLRGIPQSEELERYINEEARKLRQIDERILTCRVLAQALQRPKQHGVQLAVGLAITLPGAEVVVNREHTDDIHIAVHEAFKAAGLQLEGRARRKGDIERRGRSPASKKSGER